MNNGRRQLAVTELNAKLNRIHKLSKISKAAFHDSIDPTLSEQDREMAASKFTSMMEQMEALFEKVNEDYVELKKEFEP